MPSKTPKQRRLMVSKPLNESEWQWFYYWNQQLWQAVAQGDLEAECQAIAFLYCKPECP
jgi:hypothetical protein